MLAVTDFVAIRASNEWYDAGANKHVLVQVAFGMVYALVVIGTALAAAGEAVRQLFAASAPSLCSHPWQLLPVSLALYACVPAVALLFSSMLPPQARAATGVAPVAGVVALVATMVAVLSIPGAQLASAACS